LTQRLKIENLGNWGLNFAESELADPTQPQQQKNYQTQPASITGCYA